MGVCVCGSVCVWECVCVCRSVYVWGVCVCVSSFLCTDLFTHVFIPTGVCSLPVSDAQKKLGDPKIAEVLLSNPQEVHIGAHTHV